MNCFRGDSFTAGQRLELFVGMRNSIAAHDRLNGFSKHFPGMIQIFGDTMLVELQLAQTSCQSVVTHKTVTESDTEIA